MKRNKTDDTKNASQNKSTRQITALDNPDSFDNTPDNMMDRVIKVADFVVSTKLYQKQLRPNEKLYSKTQK